MSGVVSVMVPESPVLDVVFVHGLAGLYDYVVATRPTFDEKLDRLLTSWSTYELMPFTADQLPRFIEDWLAASGLPDSKDGARTLMSQISNKRLDALASTPLLATILCQIYTTRPDMELQTIGSLSTAPGSSFYKNACTPLESAEFRTSGDQECLDMAVRLLKRWNLCQARFCRFCGRLPA